MGKFDRALNLRHEFEDLDSAGAFTYPSSGPWQWWPRLIRSRDGRWFGDELDEPYDFGWREITAEIASEWWSASAGKWPVLPELRDDLKRQQAADPVGTPRADRQADEADALGSKAGKPAREARNYRRGELDEQAVATLLKNPTLTIVQLAKAMGCCPGTLRDPKKCPKLATARASIRDQREAFRGGSTWRDRRRDEDDA